MQIKIKIKVKFKIYVFIFQNMSETFCAYFANIAADLRKYRPQIGTLHFVKVVRARRAASLVLECAGETAQDVVDVESPADALPHLSQTVHVVPRQARTIFAWGPFWPQ